MILCNLEGLQSPEAAFQKIGLFQILVFLDPINYFNFWDFVSPNRASNLLRISWSENQWFLRLRRRVDIFLKKLLSYQKEQM